MDRIIYLGAYADRSNNPQKRLADAAASTKMDYICDALVASGFNVEIISLASVQKSKHLLEFHASSLVKVREGISCLFAPSICYSSRLTGVLIRVWLCLYFVRNIRKNDKVIVYHSLWYASLLRKLKGLLDFELILEVEEVYTIAFKLAKKKLEIEQGVIACADKYIFSNDLMATLLQCEIRKPHTVIYGQYTYCRANFKKLFDDGKIHVVYAGSIDKLRYAAHYAISAAQFLPGNYAMHILGFGAENVINEVKQLINTTNQISACKVFFEGAKQGEEYKRFLSSCDIGLNTQTAEGDYMSYAFPSKILVYLCHGLNVVTSKLSTLPISKIDPVLNYYENNDGRAIAYAITHAMRYTEPEIKELVTSLHAELVKRIGKLLE